VTWGWAAAQPLAAKILYGGRKRKSLWETLTLAADALLVCEGFIGYHNTWLASGRHLWALSFGGLSSESAQQPMLAQSACLLSFPAKSELVETFRPAVTH